MSEERIFFPFTAIVGQEKAKLGLLCCAVDPTIGGILLSGEKGTGKSSMVRALSQTLPEIEVVEGCPFNCNPRNPLEMCGACQQAFREGKLKAARRRMRVVDLPLSTTLDRLVGTIDLRRALKEGVRAFQPGLLAEANRNILYVDEVNLLEDYVADTLLDAAAMGWNIVEREGISLMHPARFILVGSMNPEEGELRPQLLDRFGLYVPIEPLGDPEERMEVVRRVEEFHRDPVSFNRKYEAEEEKLRNSISKAKQLLREVEMDEDLLKFLIETIVKLNVRTHRAEITTVKTAKAIASLEGRKKVSLEDLKRAMELALPHRLKSRPFEAPRPPQALPPLDQAPSSAGSKNPGEGAGPAGGAPKALPRELNSPGEKEKLFEAEEVQVDLRKEKVEKRDSRTLGGSRECKATCIGFPHGHAVSHTLPFREEQLQDPHLLSSINASAMRLGALPLEIEEEDLRVNIRKRRLPKLSVLVLDSSGSMGIQRRMSIAKGIAKKVIEESYKRRDFVAMIAFRGRSAERIVPPTRRYLRIVETLEGLKTGGRTPLPSALHELLDLSRSFRMKNKEGVVRAILISDGRGNVPLWRSVEEDTRALALLLAKHGIEVEIHDTRPRASVDFAPSCIPLIAELTKARVLPYD